MVSINLKQEDLEQFDRLFNAALKFAADKNLPMPIIEGACRDALAGVEARRLLGCLRQQGAKL